jgi:hypothetical protein
MTTRRGRRRRPRWITLLRLAWRNGDGVERAFVVYIAGAPFLAVLVGAIITLSSGISAGEAILLWFVALGGIVVFPAFQGPMYDSAYGLDFIRAILAQDWLRPVDREYYTELLQFRLTLGAKGRVGADLVWGLGYCALYIGNGVIGELSIVALYPSYGSPTGLALIVLEQVVAIVAGIAYSRRTIRRFKAAEKQGFRLLQLKRATRRPSSG